MRHDRKAVSRRTSIKLLGGALAAMAFCGARTARAAGPAAPWWTPTPAMDAMTAIRTRRSIRAYTDQDVTDAQVRELLGAAMAAPSAGNEQPWQFIVIRDKATLKQAGAINEYVRYAVDAPVAILVCGDMREDKYGGYWIEDVSAATQNMLLAAHAMGLGAVWTGIYPLKERIGAFRALMGAPEHIVPMCLVVIGHPKETVPPIDRYQENRVHAERWKA
ncbi:MAG: nitroreductase family protein [Desulfovibrionaceae bacterium]